jgi:hypothetical protein
MCHRNLLLLIVDRVKRFLILSSSFVLFSMPLSSSCPDSRRGESQICHLRKKREAREEVLRSNKSQDSTSGEYTLTPSQVSGKNKDRKEKGNT